MEPCKAEDDRAACEDDSDFLKQDDLPCTREADEEILILPETIQDVLSNDVDRQLDAAVKFRKVLFAQTLPIDTVLKHDVVHRFVEFLQKGQSSLQASSSAAAARLAHSTLLQLEAAKVLINIAAWTTEHVQAVIKAGAVPIFIERLSSPVFEIHEGAMCALGNIAADNAQSRDYVLQQGALPPLLILLSKSQELGLLRRGASLLQSLCLGDPKPEWDTISPASMVLRELLFSTDDEILFGACWATTYLLYGSFDQDMIDSKLCGRLVELLTHSSVHTAALRCINNIAAGDTHQTQLIIDCGALPALRRLLSSPEKGTIKAACWTISNITAGPPHQVQSVIDANIIPPLIDILKNAEQTHAEACCAISNAVYGGLQVASQARYLVSQGCIKPLCENLTMADEKTIPTILKALDNILCVGEADKKAFGFGTANLYALYVEEAGGMATIRHLQDHENFDIWRKAHEISDKYFPGQWN